MSDLFLPVVNGATIPVQSPNALAVLHASTAGILRPVFDVSKEVPTVYICKSFHVRNCRKACLEFMKKHCSTLYY